MALGSAMQKLTIVPEKGDAIQVPFNPTEYAIERSTHWAEVAIPGLDAPVLQWVRGQGDTVSLDLLLDVTDSMKDGVIIGADVRGAYVSSLEALMKRNSSLHRPPTVTVHWGTQPILTRAVVRGLSVTYTLFDVGGRPARATARLTLRDSFPADKQVKKARQNSPDRDNVATVREGDTLPAIAHREYRNANQWRAIAEANQLADPFALEPGRVLVLPKVV